ncbi:conserved hypothetical protein (DUF2811) [Synechococcus sp. BIOS-U3-1]|uniref:DUF2811 domain-containing protein n=1 Tax=Synechococcus sp. BIOS-U3-1 TaxID=1400865 RepID=UPI001646A9D3|nr:DUF2811 domain-containing protein [Synechococcus sp. BIOS-U3-1]QNI58566.1 conserved hypothetical protein (DUF2811) [Synechococcus sp. BIOS-U3-1]|tara:strand:+ start:2131 stop:2445 length:315 start_codon:yes stop_codon:yes gene_type:complete
MDRNQMEFCIDPSLDGGSELQTPSEQQAPLVSMESEIPEVLFSAMKGFIGLNPSWDQCQLMSSALAGFLYQNGCSERAVTERYLDDLFTRPIITPHQAEQMSKI